jgi:hypothetical protein
MATATKQARTRTPASRDALLTLGQESDEKMTSGTLTAPPERAAAPGQPEQRRTYRCRCGHVLRVFGGGRHRVYFELGNAWPDTPVMNRVCPACGDGLPGKNRP